MKSILLRHYPIILIIALSLLVWHKIFNQVFLGEGYYYFNPNISMLHGHQPDRFFDLDVFARLMFDILIPVFKDNILLYIIFGFILLITLYITFYTVVSRITGSKLIAFIATVFFIANYVGSFDLIATGNFQRFVQRIPNFIPSLISFHFLFLFFKTKKEKYYILSLLIFSLAIYLAHYSFLILPIFLIYPIVQLIDEKRKSSKVIGQRLLYSAAFLLISLLLVQGGKNKPEQSLLQFIQTEKNIPARVLLQIPTITIPLGLIEYIDKQLPTPNKEPYTSLMFYALIPCLVLYLGGIIIVFKKARKFLVIYLTLLSGMITSMFFYLYIDPRLNVLKYFGADRYFFVSSMIASILWAIILKALFIKNEFRFKLFSIIILTAFVYYNATMIWYKTDSIQYKSDALKQTINYIHSLPLNIKEQTVIVLPSYLYWSSPIIEMSSKNKIHVAPANDGWEQQYWEHRNNTYVLDYDYQKAKPNNGHVINLTTKYRLGEKITFLN